MKLGYVRISKYGETLPIQMKALSDEKCDKVYIDFEYNSNKPFTDLPALLSAVQEGDTVVVWDAICIMNSITECLDVLDQLNEKKVYLKILSTGIDTSNELSGGFMNKMLEFLKALKAQITKFKLKSMMEKQKKRGIKGGRKFKFNKEQELKIIEDFKEGAYTSKELSKKYDISPATIYNILKRNKINVK